MARSGGAYYAAHDEQCPHCHKLYYRKAEWQWTCFECWKRWKRENGDWNEEAYQKGQQRKTAGNAGGNYGADFDPFNFSRNNSSSNHREQAPRPEARTTVDGLDAAMVRRLIQLCHPDKHAGSEASTLATLWLLKLKERMR